MRGLLPPGCAFVTLSDDPAAAAGPALPEELTALPPSALARRRREFRLGRVAARLALIRAGLDDPPPIGRGERGEPIWPTGWTGAIAHARGLVMAAAGPASAFAGIGIDVELVERIATTDVAARICRPDERAWASAFPTLRPARLALIFCAKECIYKAFFPILGRFFGFHAAELTWDGSERHFRGRLLPSVAPGLPADFRFDVRCQLSGKYAMAALALPNTGQGFGD